MGLVCVACKERKVELPCTESVAVTERNGYKVRQTLSGLYVKADEIDMHACSSKPGSGDDALQPRFIEYAAPIFYWGKGKFLTYAELSEAGLAPAKTPVIELHISFRADPPKFRPNPAWWWSPAIPHQRYPIDLLPNFGLDQPDPNAGVGPILSKPTVYWAVRGTRDPREGTSYVTYCSMQSPPNWDRKDYSPQATGERNASWLIQAETYSEKTVGNTCRGHVVATNNKLGAMIDVPGAALPDIDKIYQAASQKLTDLTVE